MEKNEHAIFQDIPYNGGNGNFHSALLTTFTIDLIHFDTRVLNALRRKQICSINVLVDKNQLNQSLQYVSPTFLHHIGLDYCLSGISAKGAFHPKINLFVGNEAALVLIGSGNLTVTGHGKNHEVFTGFMADAANKSQRPLIEECWHYLKRFVAQTGEFEQQRLLHEIPDNCIFLKENYTFEPHSLCTINNNLKAALLYSENGSSILSQMDKLIPMNVVRKITVASPYFDEDGTTLQHFLQLCPQATMDVLIQGDCSLPPYKMPAEPRINFYDFNETKRGRQIIKDFNRLAHAKIYLFETNDMSYCIVGSANATKAGWGSLDTRGINDELCVLYASSETDILKALGLNISKRCRIEPNEFNLPKQQPPISQPRFQIKLQGAQYKQGQLNIHLEEGHEFLPDLLDIQLEDENKITILTDYRIKDSTTLVANYNSVRTSLLCTLCDKHGSIVSNKVFVNNLEQLEATNPSRTTRLINNIVSRIESEGYNGLEIIDMLTCIMGDITETNKHNLTHKSASSTPKKEDTPLPLLAYNPDHDNDDTHPNGFMPTDRVSRLIECIEENIRRSIRSMKEDLIDEEESGNCETSNERNPNYGIKEIINVKKLHTYSENAASVLRAYQQYVSRRSKYSHEHGGTLTKEDLSFFTLSMFTSVEICYLDRFQYDFQNLHGLDKSDSQKKLYKRLDHVMEHEAIEALTRFSTFCQHFDNCSHKDSDFILKGHRATKYVLLYYTCFSRFSTAKRYREAEIIKAIHVLSEHFGFSSPALLASELQPLIDRYDQIVDFKDVEKAMKRLGAL